MSAPNRNSEAARITNQHSELFAQGEDGRRAILAWLCDALNPKDGGNWGLLVKNDRTPPFIPADIIVWKPTGDHFDVLTDDGPTWIPRGVIPKEWAWMRAPAPSGEKSSEQSTDFDDAEVVAFAKDCLKLTNDVGRIGVVCARMQYDAATMGYTAARAKHFAELKAGK